MTNVNRPKMNEVVTIDRRDGIAIVTIDNPPVNALSNPVRRGILNCLHAAVRDSEVQGIVLTCAGRTFIVGADITEFGKPAQPPSWDELVTELEGSPKPIVAAIHGNAL